jgi:hypothetical protein
MGWRHSERRHIGEANQIEHGRSRQSPRAYLSPIQNIEQLYLSMSTAGGFRGGGELSLFFFHSTDTTGDGCECVAELEFVRSNETSLEFDVFKSSRIQKPEKRKLYTRIAGVCTTESIYDTSFVERHE